MLVTSSSKVAQQPIKDEKEKNQKPSEEATKQPNSFTMDSGQAREKKQAEDKQPLQTNNLQR